MRQSSTQNLPEDLALTKQTSSEAPEEVEVSDRLLPQPKSHSTKTPSVKYSQTAIDTSANTEPFLAPTSQDLTILQNASPISEVKDDDTIVQIPSNPSPHNSPMPIAPGNGMSAFSQKSIAAKQIDSSSQPNRIFEATNSTQETILQSSLKDDSENFDATRPNILQRHNDTIIQHPDSVVINNRAEQKVQRAILPSPTSFEQTPSQFRSRRRQFSQSSTTAPKNHLFVRLFGSRIFRNWFHSPMRQFSSRIFRNWFRSPMRQFSSRIFRNWFGRSNWFISRLMRSAGLFFNSICKKINRGIRSRASRKFNLHRTYDSKQPQSHVDTDNYSALRTNGEQPSSQFFDRANYNAIALDDRPSSEQYLKKLRELDICRLAFAKELARNGNFRKAIAVAEQISEMSYFFKDAQMLIQSWKRF